MTLEFEEADKSARRAYRKF